MSATTATDATVADLNMLTGQGWPWVFTRGADVIAADTVSDLCGELMDGYHTIPAGTSGDQEALVARWEYATGLAQQLQETLAGLAHNRGQWQTGDPAADHAVITDPTGDTPVEAFLLGDRRQPVIEVALWDHPVPLVLIATDYTPHTGRIPPEGNIVWLDPYTETSLIHTLTHAGLGQLYTHPESDLDPAS